MTGPENIPAGTLEGAYEDHARTCDEQDFWRQVKRTIGGKPVPDEQIDLIVETMIANLDLGPSDVLLDICCGNGALSGRFFERCAGGVGVDYSETLVGVARKYFSTGPAVSYETGEAVAFLRDAPAPDRFTKAIVYGSICYFARESAESLLTQLRRRFTNISCFVIGNIADLDRIDDFFGGRPREDGIEDRPDSAIGVWWSPKDFADMAARAGWKAETRLMPEPYYAKHYRFDAVLRPL